MGLVMMTVTQPRTSARQVRPVRPLLPEDPPKVGEFWLRGRLTANAAGIVYAGRDETGRDAAVAMMAEGSADDAAARDRFGHAVDQLPGQAVLARNSADDDDLALWVAVTDPGENQPDPDLDGRPPQVTEVAHEHAARVLSAVLMDRIPHLGRFRGPDFLHHWDGRRRPGLFRLWPLPWPATLRTASRLALILSLLTMLLLMALAILIAWLLFRNQPQVDPGPVIPDPNGTATVTVTPSSPPTSGPGTSPSNGPTTTVPQPTTGPPSSGLPTTIPSSGGPGGDPSDKF
jgi:hypothetical protein